MASPEDVAIWMKKKLEDEDYLYQVEVVGKILDDFGEDFLYTNRNGNYAIRKDVLAEFERLTRGKVVWERGQRCWRKRSSDEPKDKRQVDY